MTKSSSSREIPFLCCSEIEKQEPFNSCPHSIAAPNQKNDRGGGGEKKESKKENEDVLKVYMEGGGNALGGRQSHCSIKIVNAAEAAKGDQGILLYETSFLQVNWRRLLPKKERGGGGGSRSRDQRRPARRGIPSRADGDEKSLCPSSFLPAAKPLVLDRPELLLLWWWGERIELCI